MSIYSADDILNMAKDEDKAIVDLTWKYIDRMDDPSPYDPAEKILKEFCEEWHKIVSGGQ